MFLNGRELSMSPRHLVGSWMRDMLRRGVKMAIFSYSLFFFFTMVCYSVTAEPLPTQTKLR